MKCYRDVYKKTSMDFTMICRVILGVATFKYSQDYDKYIIESIICITLSKPSEVRLGYKILRKWSEMEHKKNGVNMRV